VDAYRQAVETGEGYKEPIEMRLVDGDVEMDVCPLKTSNY
jgi:hypothetical protein